MWKSEISVYSLCQRSRSLLSDPNRFWHADDFSEVIICANLLIARLKAVVQRVPENCVSPWGNEIVRNTALSANALVHDIFGI